MTIAIILTVLAVLSTVVGVWDKLTLKERKGLVLALIVISIGAASGIIQLIGKSQELATIAEQQLFIDDANVLNNSNLTAIDEASGGATWNNLAYIVDDEEPKIFEYKYAGDEYEPNQAKAIDILDARPCEDRLNWGVPCEEGTATKLTKKMIDDLEGAAIDRDGNLYITTSHSNKPSDKDDIPANKDEKSANKHDKPVNKDCKPANKDEKSASKDHKRASKDDKPVSARAVLLKTTLDGHICNGTQKLQAVIRELFENGLRGITNPIPEYRNRDKVNEVMQIEGLAIDGENKIYLGFRAPLVNDQLALVLRTTTDDIFSDKPQFDCFLLNLRGPNGEQYGITSLDYDAQNNRILVLGNLPEHYAGGPPVIWSWQVAPKAVQSVQRFDGRIFDLTPIGDTKVTMTMPHGSRPAKAEVLLQPNPNRIQLLFDAEGTGGQLALVREGLKVERIRKKQE